LNSYDSNYFDKDGILLKRIWKFMSPINQTMILFKDEHELAMGGPLLGKASLLLENRVLIHLDGIFSEQVLWQTSGQYVALAKWADTTRRNLSHKVSIIDVQNLQVGAFQESMFIKQFTRFTDKTVECEYYEQQSTKVFVGNLENLKFESLRKRNAA